MLYAYSDPVHVNFSVIRLKFATKWSLSYFQPILAAMLVTIETAKVIIIPDLYTKAIALINLYEEIGSFFSFFSLIGLSQNSH